MNINTTNDTPSNSIPWPSILIIIIGFSLCIYTGIAPTINSDRRIFGVIIIFLWSILFSLICYVFWENRLYSTSWLISLIPLFILSLFFILIILLNLGSP